MVVRQMDNLLVRGWMEMNVAGPLGALCLVVSKMEALA